MPGHVSPEATLLECLDGIEAPRALFGGVSGDGLRRLARVAPLLAAAVNRKGRLPLRHLVDEWRAD